MSESNAKKLFEKGITYFSNKEFILAQEYFVKALELSPNRISILENLATVYYLNGNYLQAEIILGRMDKLDHSSSKIFDLMIKVLKKLGKIKELKLYIIKELEKKKIDLKYKIFNEFLYPDFFENEQEADLLRVKFEDSLSELEKINEIELKVDKDKIDPPIFNISYDYKENLDINKKIVKLYRKFYPELNQSFINEKKNDKIRIGFLSEFFTNHTIGKLYRGIIFKLDPKKFDIFIFHSKHTVKSSFYKRFLEREILSNLVNITLPNNFDEKIQSINKKNLDIAFFPDIGMSTEFYYLSFIKFAKIQITSWGHPVTTGNNSIDYFLSSKLLETQEAQKNYSENLLLSNYLPMYFYKPVINKKLNKDELIKKNIYFCSQTLIKIHPHFDNIIKKILDEDKKAKILFIKDKNEILSKKLFERLKRAIPFKTDQITFLDQLSPENYINKCGTSSVLLDPLYFGSGNSFHESMFYGTPTVTLPTENLKSRIVLGAYKQMQISDSPTVKNIDEYVDKAVKIANRDNKTMYDNKILYSRCADKYLYENQKFILEFEEILENLYLKHI